MRRGKVAAARTRQRYCVLLRASVARVGLVCGPRVAFRRRNRIKTDPAGTSPRTLPQHSVRVRRVGPWISVAPRPPEVSRRNDGRSGSSPRPLYRVRVLPSIDRDDFIHGPSIRGAYRGRSSNSRFDDITAGGPRESLREFTCRRRRSCRRRRNALGSWPKRHCSDGPRFAAIRYIDAFSITV